MPLPFSIHGCAQIDGVDAVSLAAALRARLLARGAVGVEAVDDRIDFRAGLARRPFGDRSLGAISRGTLRISPHSTNGLAVRYSLNLRDLVVIGTATAALVGTALGLATASVEVGFVIGGAYWLALCGMNYVLTRVIFRRLVLGAAADAGRSNRTG